MREPRSNSNRSIPFQAAFLVFLAGLGTAAYFVEFRGVGFKALVATETAPEFVIVGGALLALALVTHLSVSRALGSVSGATNVRGMLRRALALADASPEEIQDDLEALPSELQDLVRMLSSQRERFDDTNREVQSLRQEMNGILQGMQRSSLSLEPMRLSGQSETSRAVAMAWNQMLERVQPQTDSASGTEMHSMDAASGLELQALLQRMEALESRCGDLEDELRSAQASLQSDVEPTFAGGTPELLLGASDVEPAPPDSDPAPVQTPAVPEAQVAPVDAPGEPVPASPSGYHEWTGHASSGDWKLNREATEAFGTSAEESPSSPETTLAGSRSGAEDLVLDSSESTASPAQPFVDDTYALPPEAPPPVEPPSGEFSFPHFVGKPGDQVEGRVEVTFDGTRESQPAGDSELPVDPDGSASRPGSVIFDLRSLGAVELDD